MGKKSPGPIKKKKKFNSLISWYWILWYNYRFKFLDYFGPHLIKISVFSIVHDSFNWSWTMIVLEYKYLYLYINVVQNVDLSLRDDELCHGCLNCCMLGTGIRFSYLLFLSSEWFWLCCIRALDSETYARELFEECVVHLKERLKEKERLREEEKVNGCVVVSYHLSAVFIAL